MTRKVATRLTHVQASEVIDRLKTVYDTDAGQYHSEWNDKKVASSFEFLVSEGSVGKLRMDLFGVFKNRSKPDLEQIQTQVNRLENDMLVLQKKLDYVTKELTIDWTKVA